MEYFGPPCVQPEKFLDAVTDSEIGFEALVTRHVISSMGVKSLIPLIVKWPPTLEA